MSQQIFSPVLVGRTHECALLDAALHDAGAGRGQCLRISGEAGVGKSRLVADLRRRAQQQSFHILQGQCFEQDHSFPFAPVVDGLRGLLADRTPTAVRELLGRYAPELVKLLPELSLRLGDLQSSPALEPEA